ncbi:MAG: glycosyl hydrolase [Actinomycetota bacterium]|nr:glycosyl hydrolase [Actinomycetota bacterium]
MMVVTLCLAASGVARTTNAHRAVAARIARADRLAPGLHGAAAGQTYFDQVVQAAGPSPTANHTPNDGDLADQQAAYNNERLAPGTTVSGEALVAGQQQANGLSRFGGPWQEVTNQPYNGNPPDYTDPFWSNIGSGFSIVGGRTTALTAAPNGTWYAGTADGGVWSSQNKGGTWSPLTDGLPSLSIGALAVDPADGSVWVGTGEANTNQDSYAGVGVYRIDGSGGIGRVGDSGGTNPLSGRTIYQISFDPQGNAYAATNNGLFRYATSSGQWTEVLFPDGLNQPGSAGYSPYNNHITTVQVAPGSGGQDVIAVEGWRGPLSGQKNGFYESTNGGTSFAPVKPSGQIDTGDIGRTTLAYSADGSKLYAVIESPAALTAAKESVLQGVFVTLGSKKKVATAKGPWKKIADEGILAKSGSALAVGSGYGVGVQAWYNQTLAVDPANSDHVYLGLEEVFQTLDAGKSWNTAAPYWNYGLACNPTCPNTTHPDQHALMVSGNQVISGNDGGVYSRALSDDQQYGGWTDTNDTLYDLQYYDARAGSQSGQTLVYGGLQDNGTSVLTLGAPQNNEPAGGDGTTVIVDPGNANKMVGSYVDGAMYSSTDGGHTFYDDVSPGCVGQATVGLTPRADCDPNIRFVTPMVQDQQNTNDWLVGGQYVWVSGAGWNTSCTPTACSWQNVFDTGSGNAVTALSSAQRAQTIYAAWVGGGGNPGPSFSRGIATNYGGSWHQLSMIGLPNRYIAGVTVDPDHPAHAYAVFNGYSRRWIPGGGVGHVYETTNGGQTWTDISGNLPDVPGDAVLLEHKQLALATDLGMYTAQAGQGAQTNWYRLGTGLPNASVNNVTPGPDGYIYAGTHGRGIWRIPFGHRGDQGQQ